MDTNRDNMLTRNELIYGKNLILGYDNIIFHPNSEFEVDKLLKNLGKNKEGSINYDGKIRFLKNFAKRL